MAAARNGRVAGRLAALALGMLALSFAAVPFYDWFCRVTGYGGATAVADAPDGPARPETIVVRFDANTAPGLPWEFRPAQRTLELRLGESALVFFQARNLSDVTTAGTASFNVTPHSTGAYFAKIECFCFQSQVLRAGEHVEMPVSFFVDPEILTDRDAQGVREITLSYTMHPSAPSADRGGDTSTELAASATPRGPQIAPSAIQN